MRRFADDDEVDLVVVGAGAGGSVLTQRLARAGWKVVCLDAGPVLGPGHRLGQRRARRRTACTGPNRARSADETRCRSDPTTPAAASAARWCTTPATRRGSTRRTSAPTAVDGVGADWPIDYGDLRPYYEAHRSGTAGGRPGLAVGRPAPLPAPRPSGRRQRRRSSCAAPPQPASRPGSGPVAITNGRFGNRPHCIYRGFCLQGCKVNAKASPLITHIPDALAHGAEIRADCHVSRIVRRRRHRARHRRHLLPRRDASTGSARGRSPSPATPSRRRGCCCCRPPSASRTAWATTTTRSGRYLMVQGAPQTAGRFPTRSACTRRRRRRCRSEQFYETDPTKPYRRGWSIQTVSPLPITWAEHVAAQGHWGPAAARVHARLRPLGHPRRALRVPAAAGQPGDPGRRDRPARPAGRALLLQPVRQRQAARRTRPEQSWRTILRAAGADEVMTIERYAHLVGGARMASRPGGRRRRRRPARLRRAEPLHRRRQRAADAGRGQPGADHHGAGRPGRRPADRPGDAACHEPGAERPRIEAPIDPPRRLPVPDA